MALDQMKKGRRPYRGQLTKTANEVEAMFQKGDPTTEMAKARLQMLCQFYSAIQEWDDKIKMQMIDDNLEDDEVEKEYDDMGKYELSFLEKKNKLEEFLNPTPAPHSPSRSSTPTGSVISFGGSAVGHQTSNVRLPKIELMKFNGELKEWLGFWSQFKKIHEDPNLEGCDKLHYLQQSMKPNTTSFQIVHSYPQTSENYPKVVEALLAQYGNNDVQLQVYVRELLKLVVNNVKGKDKMPFETLVLQLDSHLRALETLKLEQADPATWLFPLVESSLPEEILKNWQHSPLADLDGSQEDPKRTRLDILMEFLKKEVAIRWKIQLAQSGFDEDSKKISDKKTTRKSDDKVPTLAGFHISESTSCVFCGKGGHPSQECFSAMNMSHDDRKTDRSERRACFNCLRPGHSSDKCHAKVKCPVCGKRHYAIMCSPKNREQGTQQQTSGMRPESASKSRSADWSQPKSVSFPDGYAQTPGNKTKSILANPSRWTIPHDDNQAGTSTNLQDTCNQVCTAQVKLMTLLVDIIMADKVKTVRAFLDPGSQRSYILNSTAEEMGIQPYGQEMATHSVFGGMKTQTIKHDKFDVVIQQHQGAYQYEINARGSKKICNPIPRIPRSTALISHLKANKIYVTDIENDSDQTLPEIEILIGSDNYGPLFTGRIVQLNNGITAHETKLGWVLSGGREDRRSTDTVSMMVMTMTSMDAPIEDMWKLETIGIHDDASSIPAAQRELEDKNKFIETIRRKDNGRYVVKLPFQEGHPHLPNNKQVAFKRLERTTAKLLQMGKFDDYNSLLHDWADEFIEVVPAEDTEVGAHYIPHRPVFKNSLTTPVRPVFDCSCKVGKSPSLNDCLQKGSNYVLLIPELLLRFRERSIGITADIRKAFQMIEVQLKDRKFLRFHWWKDYPQRVLMEYQHKRVLFGANCSPFILGAVLEFHLKQTSPPDEVIAKKLLEGFYVDNYVGSEDTPAEYLDLKKRATGILAEAKMDLRMRMSNIDEFDDPKTLTTSILGIQWDRKADTLFVSTKDIEKPDVLTKRALLSTVQKIFDPVGILSPALIPMKIILQKQWINNRKWDDELPPEEDIQRLVSSA